MASSSRGEGASSWGARRVVATFIGGLSLGASMGSARGWNPSRPDVRIWKGHVDVVLEGSQKDLEERTSEQSRYTYRLERTVKDILQIKACGAAGALVVTPVTRDLSEKRDLDKKATNAKAQCTPHDTFGRIPAQYLTPGSWSELSAYLVSARFLLSFLEDFCQDEGLDLAGPRQRIEELEAFGPGW